MAPVDVIACDAQEETPAFRVAPRRKWSIYAAAFVLYFAAALVLQRCSGVYGSDLSHYPDEAAHVTTALMIHDYIAAGLPSAPMRFAEQYYVHYPKVSFGMWPPAFHSVAALWMLVFGTTANSMLLFMAIQCALLALMTAVFAESIFSGLAPFGIGLFLVFVPLIQYETTMFMLDLQVALLELAALLFIADYFRTERDRSAIFFGVTTAFAMLTKANANALVLVPVLLLIATRKFYLLRRRALYIAAACVVLIGGPWQLISFRFLSASVPMAKVDGSYVARVLTDYLEVFHRHLGAVVLTIAAVGIAAEGIPALIRGTRNSARTTAIASALCLLLAILAFHSVVPTPADQRYVIPAIPLLLFFFALGVGYIGRLNTGILNSGIRSAITAAVAIGAFGLTAFAVPPREQLGFTGVAQLLRGPAYKALLVCSDSLGEGALITQVALDDRRPDRFVLRASKMLSENMWFLTKYRPYFSNEDELGQFLRNTVDAIVVDRSQTLWDQDRAMILHIVEGNPEQWARLPITAANGSRDLAVYKRLGPPLRADRDIRVPMQIMLGRDLHWHQ